MAPRRRRPPALVAIAFVAAALAGTGCATKVIRLDGSGGDTGSGGAAAGSGGRADAGDLGGGDARDASDAPMPFPVPFCISYTGDGGEKCGACYDEWGTPTSGPLCCVVRLEPTTAERCVYCSDAPASAIACLRCATPGRPEDCAICQWSDNTAECRICPGASGTVNYDQCDSLRPEPRR